MARKSTKDSPTGGKTAQQVKNSLKFKVAPKTGVLSVRVGTKKYALPVEARVLGGEDHVFVSFNATSDVYTIENGKLNAMDSSADASKAYEQLNPARSARGNGRRRRSTPQIPDELSAALSKIPAGHKLVMDAKTGEWRLAKTRTRRKKS